MLISECIKNLNIGIHFAYNSDLQQQQNTEKQQQQR